jgi:hypothetical protein
MDQKPIFFYLPMKWIARDGIRDDLVRTLGKDAVAYSTVINYDRSAQFSGRKEATPPEAPDVERNPVDEAVITALAEFPFPSVRELSRGSVFRDPPARDSITSLRGATSSMGPPIFDGGTEADSGPDGNRTIVDPLGAKHAPVTRHYHLGRVGDLFVQ